MPDKSSLDALLQSLRSTVGSDRIPDILFHYTDTPGALGILGGKTLWATNALFLNDEGEIRHTADLIRRLYEREIESLHPVQDDGPMWVVRDLLHRVRYLNDTGWSAVDAYVTCFCEVDDLLSQWRGYGDRGGGFSIGFKPQVVLDAAQAGLPGCMPSLGPVLYDENEQFLRIERAYRAVRDSLMDLETILFSDEAEREAQACAEAFLREAYFHAPFFKQRTFSEEREWRLVVCGQIPDGRTMFRQHSLGPVPYVEIGLKDPPGEDAITSIRIGPRRDPALARRALDLLLRGRTVDISSSEVTLR